MQQLSGSEGLGGTFIPAIMVLAASISRCRFAAPERREPKTRAAFSRVSSRVVLGAAGGDAPVSAGRLGGGSLMSSSRSQRVKEYVYSGIGMLSYYLFALTFLETSAIDEKSMRLDESIFEN